MNKRAATSEKHLSRSMMFIMVWAGLFGIAVQFNDSVKDMALWIGVIEIVCLMIISQKYLDEREQQLLSLAYSHAFQIFAILLLVVFATMRVLILFNAGMNEIDFINTHWMGLTISVMATLLGGAGLKYFSEIK